MPRGVASSYKRSNSVICPEGVIRPILFPRLSVNQTLPSGPAVIASGLRSVLLSENSEIAPEGVIRPIYEAAISVNQRFPSGPNAMPSDHCRAVDRTRKSTRSSEYWLHLPRLQGPLHHQSLRGRTNSRRFPRPYPLPVGYPRLPSQLRA
jgi:hypothetical protein